MFRVWDLGFRVGLMVKGQGLGLGPGISIGDFSKRLRRNSRKKENSEEVVRISLRDCGYQKSCMTPSTSYLGNYSATV